MNADRRRAFVALTAAGVLWGTTVPLSKLALGWLPPGWLTLARFSIAAAILMPAARGRLRRACRPAVLASGALGYGGSVIVQNAGITRTSVSHAALITGSPGGGATAAGDGLVLASALLSATVTVAQARLLRDHDPIAMTAAQFLGAAAGVLPAAVLTESIPSRPGSVAAVLAVAGLVAVGTL